MYSIQQSEADFLLSSYRYELPPERIAQHPGERGASRLLVLDRDTGKRIHSHFSHLLEYLPKGTLLIANNSRVVPARMIGQRPSGGKMEFLLLTPMPLLEQHGEGDGWHCAEADGLIKPAKNARIGDHLVFGDDLRVEVLAKGEFGRHRVRLHWTGDIRALFESRGHLPLPPYIKEELTDKERYQTVYSRDPGSAAAPTAGLHFTPELLQRIADKGVSLAYVTLHVGLGTFRPVKEDEIEQHDMHSEYCTIPQETADLINRTKVNGGRVICVGTTSCRTIESWAGEDGTMTATGGWTNIYIYPGYRFKVMDALVTNFHLPESTLIMLVSALAGREHVLASYEEAVRERYRFFSFGDAMFIGDVMPSKAENGEKPEK